MAIKAKCMIKIGDNFPYQDETFRILIMEVFDCEVTDGQNKYSVTVTTIPVNELVKYNVAPDSCGTIPLLVRKGNSVKVSTTAMTPSAIIDIVEKRAGFYSNKEVKEDGL